MLASKGLLSVNTPAFVFVSNVNCLTLDLVKQLKKHYQIIIATNEKRKWLRFVRSENVTLRNLFFTKTEGLEEKMERVDYLVFVNYPTGEVKKNDQVEVKKQLLCVYDIEKKFKPKTIFVVPIRQDRGIESLISGVDEKISKAKDSFLAKLYVGDMVSEDIDGTCTFEVNKLVKELVKGRQKKIEAEIYLIERKEAVKKILKAMLSLGAYGKSTNIFSQRVGPSYLEEVVRNGTFKDGDMSLKISKLAAKYRKTFVVKKSKKGIAKHGLQSVRAARFQNLSKINWFFVIIIILISPYLLMVFSVTTLWVGGKSLEKNNLVAAQKIFEASNVSSQVLETVTKTASQTPVAKSVYQIPQNVSDELVMLAKIGSKTVALSKNVISLSDEILGVGEKNFEETTSQVRYDVGYLYEYLNRFSAEKGSLSGVEKSILDFLVNDSFDDETLLGLINLMKVSRSINQILGKEDKKTYLLLLQNSSVLRPSGGVVEEIVFMSFVDNKLENVEVRDSGFVDENINGFIVIPRPYGEQLGDGNWKFSDVGLSVDFSDSSKDTSWFIGKSLDRKIDGVASIDSEVLKVLENEYGLNFDGDNMDELMQKYSDLGLNDKFRLMNFILEKLKNKRIQLYHESGNIQDTLSKLGVAGEFVKHVCQVDNCESSVLGVFETNLGEDGSKEIGREIEVAVSFEEGVIKKKVYYFLENTSVSIYRAYVNVVSSDGFGFGKVKIFGSGNEEEVKPEVYGRDGRKEAGIVVELEKGVAKALIFELERGTNLDFSESGSYLFSFIKQSGVGSAPFEIKFDAQEGKVLSLDKTSSLTQPGISIYNTELLSDFNAQICWE